MYSTLGNLAQHRSGDVCLAGVEERNPAVEPGREWLSTQGEKKKLARAHLQFVESVPGPAVTDERNPARYLVVLIDLVDGEEFRLHSLHEGPDPCMFPMLPGTPCCQDLI